MSGHIVSGFSEPANRQWSIPCAATLIGFLVFISAQAAPSNSIHFGNSQTATIAHSLPSMAYQAGHTPWDMKFWTAPGVCVKTFIANSAGDVETHLSANGYDAVVLQMYCDTSDERTSALWYAERAYTANPACQMYLYSIWPYGAHNWDDPPRIRSEVVPEWCRDALIAAYPSKPAPKIIPASLIMRELGKLADRGELPNVMSHLQLLSDGTHPSAFGKYAVLCATVAVMTNESPLGYPLTTYKQAWDGTFTDQINLSIPEETATVIKQVVWDVLTTYEYSGIDIGLVIVDRSLPVAVVDRSYSHQLTAIRGQGTVQWSVAPGTSVPAGMSLSSTGTLSGTPGTAGTYRFTVQAQDEVKTVRKEVALDVCADEPPHITTTSIGPVPLDSSLFIPVSVTGGVGALSWSLASGRIPHNVTLSPGGVLWGTPGHRGSYTFTVRVEDSHPAGARSHEQSFSWDIGAPNTDPVVVRKALDAFTIDGVLDEPEWATARECRIAKQVNGTCDKTATFRAVWDYTGSRRGNLILGVEVKDGASGVTTNDAVEVFIDALNNREIVYNSDDRHSTLYRDPARFSAPWYCSGKVKETTGGFTLELRISDTHFFGQPSVSDLEYGGLGAGTVYGFDVGIQEGSDSDVRRKVWRGTADNAENPSQFGTILLTDIPALDATVDTSATVVFRDGDFQQALWIVPSAFQVCPQQQRVWYQAREYWTLVSDTGGNPGAYIRKGYAGGNLFVCLPSPDQAETWTISYDERQEQQWSASSFKVYGLDTYDQITARTGAFSGLTPFYSENTGVSDTWRRLTYDVDIPAGYGTIVCRWSSNQPGSMAGIDNFLVTRDASVNRGEPAVAATRKITTRFVNGRMICSLPTAVRRLTVDVFTLTGRRAKHVAHRTLDAGTYTIPLAELPAGHYTVRIVVDDLERLHRFSRL